MQDMNNSEDKYNNYKYMRVEGKGGLQTWLSEMKLLVVQEANK